MMESNRSLDILTQPGEELVIKGEPIEVKKFTLASLPKMVQVLQNVSTDLMALLKPDNGITLEKGRTLEIDENGWNLIHSVIERNIGNIADILSAYTRKPKAWFLDEGNGVDIDETILLMLTILERHYDFFTKRCAPILGKLQAKATGK